MKTIVSIQDLIEFEIKPGEALAEFYALTEHSIGQQLAAPAVLRSVPCPGCGSSQSNAAFDKYGFTYRQCRDCATVYVSPRPSEAALIDYYRNSPAARFWREKVLPATESARLEKITRPRARWVLDGLAEYAPQAAIGLDLSSHGGALVSELLSAGVAKMIAAGPLADVDFASPPANVQVSPRLLAGTASLGPVDFVTAFDAFDRCADVTAFIAAISRVLRPGGLLFLAAPSISGFDLQVLWDRSRAITPPDKLNLLSVEGFNALFAAPGWEICELSTPGMFDVETVRQAVEADPGGGWPRFVCYLLENRDEGARMAFQEFLQAYRLSSFARLLVRKAN